MFSVHGCLTRYLTLLSTAYTTPSTIRYFASKPASSKQTLWAAGHDEVVEVNQRDLINKVLARYSGKFTVFRELLQNSDDAEARSVEIRFETAAYLSRENGDDLQSDKPEREDLPDLKTAVACPPMDVQEQWHTIQRPGLESIEEDWCLNYSHLSLSLAYVSLAEGNPDEEKIGAFGVGFYSLFSVTDEPWVTSGGQWMNFYWKDKKNQLYARRGTIPASVDDVLDPWSTFQMTLREPGPIPAALDFASFLASSITFMTHLSEVSVYFDDKRLVKLSKDCGMSKEVAMLNGLKGTSPDGMMNVKSIETMPLHIEAEVVRWVYNVGSEKPSTTSTTDTLKTATHQSGFFSTQSDQFEASSTPAPMLRKKPINLFGATSSNIVLTIFTANVEVRLDEKVTGELLRSTMKKPPSRLRYQLIYTGKEEYDSSVKAEKEAAYAAGSVFQGLRADLKGTGSTRVFIGHSTGQRTGIGGHMAARFIPTVERESIDLVDRHVAVWNKELLYVGGFLARSVYEFELDAIKKLWDSAAAVTGLRGLPDEEVQTRLRGRALHALKFFTFHPSTPSPVVSNLMETAFFACATTHPFSIISSEGFLKRLPVIHEDIVNGARAMVAALRSRAMIKVITFVDVIDELCLRPLSETEMVECLKWWISVTRRRNRNLFASKETTRFLNALVVSVSGPPEKTMKLSDAQTFLNSKAEAIIPTDGPLPSTVIPTSITGSFDPGVLASVFPWKQLSIIEWLRHVTDIKVAAANAEFDVTRSAPWAERVLFVLAQAWLSLSTTAQQDILEMFHRMPCIPTSTGLKVPNQAYFPNVNLLRDLPIVTMPSGATVTGGWKTFLQTLGVRKNVELEIILDRAIVTGDWPTFDLVKYLVSVQLTLTEREMSHLRETPAFPKESAGKEQLADGTSPKAQRYRAKDLYEPIDIFRELGLPIIDWGANNQWRPESDKGKFLSKFIFSLGLRRVPPLTGILHIAASDNPSMRKKAFSFFLDNISKKKKKKENCYFDYDPNNFQDLAFIPAILGSEKVLAKPFELCTDAKWAALGFTIVDPTLRSCAESKLKLNKHPPTSELVTLLKISPPEDEATARQWFQALSGCVLDFSPAQLQELQEIPFLPVKSAGDKNTTKRLQPNRCFLGAANSELYSKLFAFVDFGARANIFLGACGARQAPSVEDFAQLLLAEPRTIYELANGRENYLDGLRNLAVNGLLMPGITSRMKGSNVLLGSRRMKKDGGKALGEGNQQDWDFQDDLLQPNEVAIVDDTNAYRLFGHRIFCAPQEDILEELYLSLGSPRLSSLVKEHYRTSGEAPYSKIGPEVRHLILERLPLFLHEHPRSGIEISLNWLNKEKNFIVRVFGKLLVIKSLHHGDIRDSRSHEASAVAKREGNGPIELWLSGNKQVNMYECVADFVVLHRLVDGILQQQKAGRQTTEKAEREEAEKAKRCEEVAKTKILTIQTNVPLPSASTVIAVPETSKPFRQTSANHKLGHHLQRNRSDAASSQLTSSPPDPDGASMLAIPASLRESVQSRTFPTVTSLSNIADNIDMALRACAPERSDLLRNREDMHIVLESLDEGYCHVTHKTRDLELVGMYSLVAWFSFPLTGQFTGSMGDMKVFAAPDLPEPESLIQRKRDVLARFIHILKPLVELYRIPQTSLQVFADKEGQLISFNRSGCLVMNLRYFEAWHDFDVQRGDFNKALISWYFMLAHGIAHNLVYPHNLEHEFYVSAICEAYLEPLFSLLSDPRQAIS
ncbi:hypothetical protein F5888DRAFT_1634399 [Russula emetica]|nr:hypothetical protein F5888DRAFT_1634399 [Russula emetica]